MSGSSHPCSIGSRSQFRQNMFPASKAMNKEYKIRAARGHNFQCLDASANEWMKLYTTSWILNSTSGNSLKNNTFEFLPDFPRTSQQEIPHEHTELTLVPSQLRLSLNPMKQWSSLNAIKSNYTHFLPKKQYNISEFPKIDELYFSNAF